MPRSAVTRSLLAAAALALLGGVASAAGVETAAYRSEIAEAREALDGAELDVADAKSYLAELKAGHFEGIFSTDGDTLRCGEPAVNPGCAPLTEKDKADAIAEAEEMVANATAALHEARAEVAMLEGKVQNASLIP